ncbi:MAG TPA: hypothetical protein VF546_01155 [Pyrinomonadaceae bacterium]|jgi:hypothetical protein
MEREKEILLRVGKDTQRGDVRLSAHAPHALSVSVSYKGDRAATVLLTRAQVRELRAALAALEPLLDANEEQAALGYDGLKLAA